MKTNFEDFIAGDATKSNWPDLPSLPQRKTQQFYAIDVAGETLATSQSLAIARQVARQFRGVVRFVQLQEEDHLSEYATNKARKQLGDFSHDNHL